jgi:hypothetical protein
MFFEKAAYWMAVGVLALVISNNLAARHQGDIRCLASRSLAAVEQFSGHATRVLATAEMMLGRGEPRYVRAQTMVACAQSRLASVQSILAERESALARVQTEHARMVTIEQLRSAVICPRQNLRMTIPQPLSNLGEGTI